MSNQPSNTTTSTEDLVNIDDFLPLPGAEDIITGEEGKKPNMFSNTGVDTSFLDNPTNDDTEDDDKGEEDGKKKRM